MILGRPLVSWQALVVLIAAAVIATARAAGITVDLGMVAADIAVASGVLALLANKAVNGSLVGRAKQ
jgi:hypothetical protein